MVTGLGEMRTGESATNRAVVPTIVELPDDVGPAPATHSGSTVLKLGLHRAAFVYRRPMDEASLKAGGTV